MMKIRFALYAAVAGLALPIATAQAEEQDIDPARVAELECRLAGICGELAATEATREKAEIEGEDPRKPWGANDFKGSTKPKTMSVPSQKVAYSAPVSQAAAPGRRASSVGAAKVDEAVRGKADLFVTFRLGSAELEPSAMREVATLAKVIGNSESAGKPIRLRIAGHTDSTGRDEINDKLSADRAAAVREALIAQGVKPELLESVGYGSAQPVEGRRPSDPINRRVEAVVID